MLIEWCHGAMLPTRVHGLADVVKNKCEVDKDVAPSTCGFCMLRGDLIASLFLLSPCSAELKELSEA